MKSDFYLFENWRSISLNEKIEFCKCVLFCKTHSIILNFELNLSVYHSLYCGYNNV